MVNTRRLRLPLVLVATALVLAFFISPTAVAASENPSSYDVPGADFGPNARLFSSIADFENGVIKPTMPIVAVFFPMVGQEKEDGVRANWAPFVSQLSQILQHFGVDVAYIPMESEVAKALAGQSAPEAMLLLFNGVHELASDGKLTKKPEMFQGELQLTKVSRWVLETLSYDHVERIHNEESLRFFFEKYPKYPTMPRVLYFPTVNITNPMYISQSQRFYVDAVFGVMVDPFATEEKRKIAERYNIKSDDDLPAVLLLTPSSANEDHVRFMYPLDNTTSSSKLGDFLLEQLPDGVAARSFRTAAQGEQQNYILEESKRIRAAATRDIVAVSVKIPLVRPSHSATMDRCLGVEEDNYCFILFVRDLNDGRPPLALRDGIVELFLRDTALSGKTLSYGVPHDVSGGMRRFFGIKSMPALVLVIGGPNRRFYVLQDVPLSKEAVMEFYQESTPMLGKPFSPSQVPSLRENDKDDGDDDDL